MPSWTGGIGALIGPQQSEGALTPPGQGGGQPGPRVASQDPAGGYMGLVEGKFMGNMLARYHILLLIKYTK